MSSGRHPTWLDLTDAGAQARAREHESRRTVSDQRCEEHKLTGRYEIRIKGRVSEETASAFEGLAVEVRPVETVLHGDISDQAALHGFLDRVADLGLELIEVRRLPEAPSSRAVQRSRTQDRR